MAGGHGAAHRGGMTTEQKRPPAAAQRFNKVAVKAAGSRLVPLWASVEHRGRRSGRTYTTPVAIVAATPDSLYIGLPWGPGTDWVRNLQAAGGGRVRWKGTTYAVSDPVIVRKDEALAAARGIPRRMMTRWGLDDYLRLRRRPTD